MSKTFKADPFELSPEQKAERIAEARAYRLARREREEMRALEDGTADTGRLLNMAMNGMDRVLSDDGPLAQMAEGAFGDPDGDIGATIAGVGDRFRIRRGHGAPEEPAEPIPDSPPIQLRMPRS